MRTRDYSLRDKRAFMKLHCLTSISFLIARPNCPQQTQTNVLTSREIQEYTQIFFASRILETVSATSVPISLLRLSNLCLFDEVRLRMSQIDLNKQEIECKWTLQANWEPLHMHLK